MWLGYCIINKEKGTIVKTGRPRQTKIFKNPGICKTVIKQSQYCSEDTCEIAAVMGVVIDE